MIVEDLYWAQRANLNDNCPIQSLIIKEGKESFFACKRPNVEIVNFVCRLIFTTSIKLPDQETLMFSTSIIPEDKIGLCANKCQLLSIKRDPEYFQGFIVHPSSPHPHHSIFTHPVRKNGKSVEKCKKTQSPIKCFTPALTP